VAYDRSGDGDFNDTVGGTPEIAVVLGGSGNSDCIGLAFDSSGRLSLAYQSTAGAARLARDGNGDGDVNDSGENSEIAVSASVCDVERSAGGGLQYVHGGPGGLTRLRDENDDGHFSDPGESAQLLASPVTAVEIGSDAATATETKILFDD